ncbi:unnamed protein product [marine sediment metagenome]|uniref:Uncharacterized protein n=1 Tax=marine sediment metagenome TaxID=412755 RepID=X1RV55_9ZZZZ
MGVGQVTDLKKYSEGVVNLALDTEETILEMVGLGEISGWVSLKNMEDGDKVTIESHVKLGSGSAFELHESDSYSDVQTKSSLRFLNFVGCYGIKITLTQTAGTPRTYPYLFFRKG